MDNSPLDGYTIVDALEAGMQPHVFHSHWGIVLADIDTVYSDPRRKYKVQMSVIGSEACNLDVNG